MDLHSKVYGVVVIIGDRVIDTFICGWEPNEERFITVKEIPIYLMLVALVRIFNGTTRIEPEKDYPKHSNQKMTPNASPDDRIVYCSGSSTKKWTIYQIESTSSDQI